MLFKKTISVIFSALFFGVVLFSQSEKRITTYLRFFETVESMVNDQSLFYEGQRVVTNGFRELGDGGGAEYYVRKLTIDNVNSIVIDTAFNVPLWGSYYAELILPNAEVDVRKIGAIPNDGVSDVMAMKKLSEHINNVKGVNVTFPRGEYIVCSQNFVQGLGYEADIGLTITNGRNLVIRGVDAVLTIPDSLRVGAWDVNTPDTPIQGNATTSAQVANIGRVINISACENCIIENLEIDGKQEMLKLGGFAVATNQYTSVHHGIGMLSGAFKNVTLRNLVVHGFALDGIYMTLDANQGFSQSNSNNITLENIYCYENARMGLTIGGGFNVSVRNSVFERTGINTITAPVNAGVDIETGGGGGGNSDNRYNNVIFENVIFGPNAGDGVTVGGFDEGMRNIKFNNCTFWQGTTLSNSYAVNYDSQGAIFEDCDIHGKVLIRAEQDFDRWNSIFFRGCVFDDIEHETYPASESSGYMISINCNSCEIEYSNITATKRKPFFIEGGAERENYILIKDSFVFLDSLAIADQDFFGIARKVIFEGVEFDAALSDTISYFFLNRDNTSFSGSASRMISDQMTWGASSANKDIFISSGNNIFKQRQSFLSAPPLTEYYQKGSIVYNSDPDSGEAYMWICTSSGNPATWVVVGTIP